MLNTASPPKHFLFFKITLQRSFYQLPCLFYSIFKAIRPLTNQTNRFPNPKELLSASHHTTGFALGVCGVCTHLGHGYPPPPHPHKSHLHVFASSPPLPPLTWNSTNPDFLHFLQNSEKSQYHVRCCMNDTKSLSLKHPPLFFADFYGTPLTTGDHTSINMLWTTDQQGGMNAKANALLCLCHPSVCMHQQRQNDRPFPSLLSVFR